MPDTKNKTTGHFAPWLISTLRADLGCVPQLTVAATLSQTPVIKAEDAGHSGPMSKSDNAENGRLARVPKGWGPFCAELRYSRCIWPTKPQRSCLVLHKNDHQRHPRAITGRSLMCAGGNRTSRCAIPGDSQYRHYDGRHQPRQPLLRQRQMLGP